VSVCGQRTSPVVSSSSSFLPSFLASFSLPNRQSRIPSSIDPAGSVVDDLARQDVMGLLDSLLNWLRRFPSSSLAPFLLAPSFAVSAVVDSRGIGLDRSFLCGEMAPLGCGLEWASVLCAVRSGLA
jgi:hypothetical protein